MRGLPASGKTTKAKEIVETTGNTVRINKDLLREMLHFNKWSGVKEGMTREAARDLATYFLYQNINVVIDDTNLNEGTLQSWKDLAKSGNHKFQVVEIETPLSECLARDTVREKAVGHHVIIGMALQSKQYPQPEKGFVICDIDGTLADIEHRRHLVGQEKKDWKGFFELASNDSPKQEVVDMVKKFRLEGYKIILCSGRPEAYREPTEQWLLKAFGGHRDWETILMRKTGDSRQDDIVKQQIFDSHFKGKYLVHAVIDDRPSVIRMWKANGLNVIDVGNGIEF